MEIDAIKLAKKLSPYTPVTLIAKKGCFLEKECSSYNGFNGLVLKGINFKSTLSLSIIIQTRKIIKEQKIRNIIFFGASELKSLYFAFLGLDINLIIRHGTTKSKPKKDWFHRLIYSKVNYHVSICKHLENNVNYIIPFGTKTQSKLIYSSFDFEKPKRVKHNKLTLLHVGRIARGKGQIDAIKACEILVKNGIDFEFNIVGGFDNSYDKEFLKFYENCAYKEKINLVGFTSDTNAYLQTADIFLFPSHGEGLSNSFLEALAQSLVCISYDNTSFPELRELGFYFEMCDNKNITDLQKILLDAASNLNDKANSAELNYVLTKKLFSLKDEICNYLEILK